MTAPSVCVSMPTYDTMQVATCLSLIKTMDKLTAAKVKATINTFKCPYVGYGRNVLTAMFLESNMNYQLFVDADVEFEPEVIGRMLLADKDIICAPYRKKTQDNSVKFSVAFPVSWGQNEIFVDKKGIAEISKGPAGLTLIKRSVYEKLIKARPDLKIKQKEIISDKANEYFYNFWDTSFDKESGFWWGEDVNFCNIVKENDIKVHALVDAVTTHHGSYGWKGRLVDTFKKIDSKH